MLGLGLVSNNPQILGELLNYSNRWWYIDTIEEQVVSDLIMLNKHLFFSRNFSFPLIFLQFDLKSKGFFFFSRIIWSPKWMNIKKFDYVIRHTLCLWIMIHQWHLRRLSHFIIIIFFSHFISLLFSCSLNDM